VPDKHVISPSEKIAIFLLAIGPELAADLLKRLSKKEVQRITAAMSRLNQIEQSLVDSVLNEFVGIIESPDQKRGLSVSKEDTKLMISKAFGHSEFAQSLSHYFDKLEPSLDAIELADASLIARTISFEHPQTIALILAHCPPQKAADILRLLSDSLRSEVIKRVAKLEKVDSRLIDTLNEALEEALRSSQQSGVYSIGGPKKAAAILNALSDRQKDILSEIEEKDAELSSEIEAHLLTFEDLARLSPSDLRTLFQHIDKNTWTLALRKASDELKENLFASMSERAASLLQEDIESLGPQPVSEVKKAQAEIIKVVRALEEEGKINLSNDAQVV
jgi:flagellar motor switch protein FliG